jgi:hypothetical protein
VNDTDRAPVITDAWPQNNTEVSYGANVKFCATATDPDGDALTFVWRLSDGNVLKTQSGVGTSSFSKMLAGGKQHIVVLEVSDSVGGVTREYFYIKVGERENGNEIPWMAIGWSAAAALAAVMLVILAGRKPKKIRPDR